MTHPIVVRDPFDRAYCEWAKAQGQKHNTERLATLSDKTMRVYRILRVRGKEPRASYSHREYAQTIAFALTNSTASVESVHNELVSAGVVFTYRSIVRIVDPGLAEAAEIFHNNEV
jgi:hypothetical protein